MHAQDRPESPDLGVLLAVARTAFFDQLHRHMEERGFSGFTTRTGFLLRVLDSQALSLREVADRLEVSSPAALKVVVAMEREGYVQRVSAPRDRRVRAIAPTVRGLAALAEARTFHRECEERLTARLGADDVAALRRGLAALGSEAAGSIPSVLRAAPTVASGILARDQPQ